MTDHLDRLRAALADRYRVEREIGSGGMATVYLAEDLKHHRQVAIKTLRPDLAATLGPERFLREIEVAAQLQHPNVLPLLDSGEADGFLYYVMPYVEGPSLRDKLVHEGELPIDEAVRILRDIVDALTEAHARGLVHRDIKPENVLLRGRHALVTDFGVAKAVSEATGRQQLTTAGVALGTPAYMAPEQAAADPHTDHRADIYAVGAVAYELLAGRPPFLGTTPQMVLSAHVTEPAEPVTKYREAVPPALAALVARCLEKKPADRWQSGEELLLQLESLATPSGGITPTETTPVRVTRSRRGGRVIGSGVAVLAVVAVAGWFFLRGRASAQANPKIVVAPLENRTGDASANVWGDLAAEWIDREMDRSGVLAVTPMSSVRRFWAERAADGSRPLTELADRVGAGTVVTGYYRVTGQTVSFSTEILDRGSGELVSALDPVTGSVDSVEAVIATLAQRVVAAVAVQFDRQLPTWVRRLSTPPSLEAFREFQSGVELFQRSQYRDALAYFDRALAIDSTWTPALSLAAVSWYNLGEYARSESLFVHVNQFRDRLTAFEREQVDWLLRGWLAGDLQAELRVAREMAQTDSVDGAYRLGVSALRNNRPREAVQALSAADTADPATGRWIAGWTVYAGAAHAAGDYETELAIARETRRRFPERLVGLNVEVRALIALGRVDEAWDLLDEALAFQPPGTPGGSLRSAALEFRAHGFDEDAERALHASVAWYHEHMAPSERLGLAESYYGLGDWDAADSLYQILFAESPKAYWHLGMLGAIAARRGDRDSALAVSHMLEEIDLPYARGVPTAYRAKIAAVLGDRDQAVALLRRSFEQGRPCCEWTHTDPDMRLLIGYAPYDRFVRPKG